MGRFCTGIFGRFGFALVGLLLVCLSDLVEAGGGPENLILVVNQSDSSSLLLANHYCQLRGIPSGNVVYLSGVPKKSTLTLEEFRNLILKPVFEAIRDRKLEQQVDLVVYSSGFPAAVEVGPAQELFFKKIAEQGSPIPEEMKKVFAPTASITTLTYFAVAVLQGQPAYFPLDSNRYYRGEASQLLERPFVGQLAEQFAAALKAMEAGEYAVAMESLEPLQEEHPGQVAVTWQIARAHALLGHDREAVEALTKCVRNGLQYRGLILAEPAFKSLLEDPLFKGLVSRIPDERFDYQLSHSFSSRHSWGLNGAINGNPEQGMNYLLSTMLAYTWDTGMSEKDALEALRRAVAADGTRPKGTIYFTDTADIRTTTRKPGFAAAMLKLKRLGQVSEISQATVPPGKRDLVGAMLGSAGINWPEYSCEITPGAIVENLTSYGAVFGPNPGQTQCTEFIKWGAAGSSGTVVEPYALQQKFPHPMIQVHYARGCSLAESFYQSVQGPMQLLVIGDALCQPFAEFPEVTAGEVPKEVSGTIRIGLQAKESSPEVAGVEIYLDGRLAGRRTGLTDVVFESEKVSDGYHELRLVPVAAGMIQPRKTLRFELMVSNLDQSVRLKSNDVELDEAETLEISAETTLKGPLRLLRGAEVLAENGGNSAKFSLPARKLGRGEVDLIAVSVDERGRDVRSRPLRVTVTGALLTQPEIVNKPPTPKPEPPPVPAKPPGG